MQSHVVLQIKQHFAYESQHQHGVFDMTGAFNGVFFFLRFAILLMRGGKNTTKNRTLEFDDLFFNSWDTCVE